MFQVVFFCVVRQLYSGFVLFYCKAITYAVELVSERIEYTLIFTFFAVTKALKQYYPFCEKAFLRDNLRSLKVNCVESAVGKHTATLFQTNFV